MAEKKIIQLTNLTNEIVGNNPLRSVHSVNSRIPERSDV